MSLHIMRKRNPFYPVGTWIECSDQGCQRARVETNNGRLEVVKTEGLLLPQRDLAPFMMKTLNKGLDK